METDQPSDIKLNNEDPITYESHLNFPSAKIASIIANSLNVDAEYTSDIQREIIADDCRVIMKYTFKACHVKNFKKSIKAMYENMELVVETIKNFEPKSH